MNIKLSFTKKRDYFTTQHNTRNSHIKTQYYKASWDSNDIFSS